MDLATSKEQPIKIAYSIPYRATEIDRLDDEIYDNVKKAMDLGIAPDAYFSSVFCAWQYAIDDLKKDLDRAYKRFYLKYQRNEPAQEREYVAAIFKKHMDEKEYKQAMDELLRG